jgi:hypothetical protein
MEMRSCNHCCCQKATTMTCCKCVSNSYIFSAVCLLTTWTNTFFTVSCPLWNFPPSETLFYNLGQLLHTRMPASDGCPQPPHLSSTSTIWSIFVHDSHLPLSTTGAVIPLTRNLRHLLLPSIVWMFKYTCPVTRTFFVWLGVCVHTLWQQVSNVYEWPSCIGFHVKDPLFLSDFNAAWIFWANFRKMPRYQMSRKSLQSFVSSVFHIYASPVNCTCYLLLK